MSSEYENPFEILAEMEEDAPSQTARSCELHALQKDEMFAPVNKKAVTIVVLHQHEISYHGFSKNKTLKWMLRDFATSGKELSYEEKRVLFALLLHPTMCQFLNNRHIPRVTTRTIKSYEHEDTSKTHITVLKKDYPPVVHTDQVKQKAPPKNVHVTQVPRKTTKEDASWQKYNKSMVTYHEIVNARDDTCFLSSNEAESVYRIWVDARSPATTVFRVFCVDGCVTVSLESNQ